MKKRRKGGSKMERRKEEERKRRKGRKERESGKGGEKGKKEEGSGKDPTKDTFLMVSPYGKSLSSEYLHTWILRRQCIGIWLILYGRGNRGEING